MKITVEMAGNHRNKPKVLEIIGPAGAGKTTFYRALEKYPQHFRLSNFPDVHKTADAPFFIGNGLQLVPPLLRLSRRDSRQLSRREFAWMSVLRGWPGVLQKDSEKSARVTVLDQGPVYLLAEMREFGPDYLQRPAAERFWERLYRNWGTTLDMVVWLDAPNSHLLERIRGREQEHIVKGESDSKIIEFLDCYRRIFNSTVSVLTEKNPDLRILKYDTGVQKTQEMVDHLLAEIEPE